MARRKTSNPHPALVLALGWLIPGAGHVCIGRAWRGVIIFLVIGATFWAGVGMGGVLTVDPATERWWFYSEMCAGAHGLVGWRRQHQFSRDIQKEVQEVLNDMPRVRSKAEEQEQRRFAEDSIQAERGVALVYPTDVVARAYAGVAGLLNLLCVFDATVLAAMGVRGEPHRRRDVEEGET